MPACTVLLEIQVKPEHSDGMAEGFKAQFPDTRAFDGCIDLYVSRNQDDPNNFVIVDEKHGFACASSDGLGHVESKRI